MSFIDAYKRLEKLCGEIYNDNHGVSSYIKDMEATDIGAYYVSGWDDDLRKLKHYRWVRNQIVHELDCTEDNMCEPGDVQWLEDFRSRIMSGNDPLALYRKARTPKPPPKPIPRPTQTCTFEQNSDYTHQPESDMPKQAEGCATWLLLLFAVIVVIVAILYMQQL